MDQEIKTLMQATVEGRLPETLKSHKITPELGAAARHVFIEATEAHDGGTAMTAAFLAATIYQALGDQINQILNLVDFLQVQFMVANDVQKYQTVRERALEVLVLADAAKSRQYAFYATVLAADSAYFTAQAANNNPAWILTTLRDLTVVCDRAQGFQKDFFFVRFVDLLATAVNTAMYRVFSNQEQLEIDSLLRAIARWIDELVPADFEFPGNPQQTSKIAAILTALTDKYAP